MEPPFDYTALFTRYKGLAKELPFTREDVSAIRAAAKWELQSVEDSSQWKYAQNRADELNNIAARIEALLPPEG